MSEKSFQPLKKGKVISNAFVVYTNGKAFHGWEVLSIKKGMGQIANGFEISLYNRFSGISRDSWPLKPGTNVHFHIGEDSVATGRIDKLDVDYTPKERGYKISGRSKAGDLVDACHEGPFEYNDMPIIELARELVAPFGIKIVNGLPADQENIVTRLAIKPGETVFEALDRAARGVGAMWISTAEGNILLTRTGRVRAFSSLEQDVNVISAEATYDDSKRHDRYIVKGQNAGTDDFYAGQAAEAEAEATDRGVKRHRPLVLVSESGSDSANAQERANWEAATRLADSLSVQVTVKGWRQSNGALWDINRIVRFKSAFLGLDRDLLISDVEHQIDGNGTITKMTLKDKNAFLPEPEKNEKDSDDVFAGLGEVDD